jgi:hypothetical protein
MSKLTVIIENSELYKKKTGLTKEVGSTVEHSEAEIKILLAENIVSIPELTLQLMEEKRKRVWLLLMKWVLKLLKIF